MGGKPIVLFLCTGNSARSQLAQALLRHHAGDRFEAHSAGVAPADRVHPLALRVLEEAAIPAEGLRPKGVREYLGVLPVDHLVTVCSHAAESCPSVWPGTLTREHWPLDDPAACDGPEEERLRAFRRMRDEIARRVLDWAERRQPGRPGRSASARTRTPR